MSWAATSYVKQLRVAPNGEAITKGEKLVLFVLADYYNDERLSAWTSFSRLAVESLHTRRGVVLTLQALERKGVLCVIRSSESATKRVTNRYRFPGLESHPYSHTGATASPGLVKPLHQAGETTSPGLVKPLHPIFKENLSTDLSKDTAGQVPGTVSSLRGAVPPKSAAVWDAYCKAYERRYGIEPVRNRKTNALLCQLVDRLGAEDAPKVAAFYVHHPKPVYVSNRHPATLLLRDAEGLRTECFTGRISGTMPKTFADSL